MKVHPLASSSKGNAYAVEHRGQTILIDDGLPFRTLKERLTAAGLGIEGLIAVLITHSHSDHTSGLPTLLRRCPELDVYANSLTAESIAAESGVAEDRFVCFENGQPFAVGPFAVQAFTIPHDTADPVGYLLKVTEAGRTVTYFHGTDIGTPLDSIGLKLGEADIATLESNHDPQLLRASGRPPMLIRRIAGRSGHLANADAAELVSKFASPRLKRLYLAHLSADCNTPELAAATMGAALRSRGREDVEVVVCAP